MGPIIFVMRGINQSKDFRIILRIVRDRDAMLAESPPRRKKPARGVWTYGVCVVMVSRSLAKHIH